MNRITNTNLFADTIPVKDTGQFEFSELSAIKVKHGLTSSTVEASGILFLEESNNYIVVSDDTDKKEPALFIMDGTDSIYEKVLVKGIKAINDIEGVSRNAEGTIYLLTSQSFNRKGKQAQSRKLLVKVKRKGTTFRAENKVYLFDVLTRAALKNEDGNWERYILKGGKEASIDIEGIACRNGSLLLGCKNPKINNRAVILKIDQPEVLFTENVLDNKSVSLWQTIPLFDDSTATFCGISDLMVINDELFGTATGVQSRYGIDTDIGLVWQYSTENKRCRILKRFTGLKPEGITYNREKNMLQIVFDNGAKNVSQIMKVKVHL